MHTVTGPTLRLRLRVSATRLELLCFIEATFITQTSLLLHLLPINLTQAKSMLFHAVFPARRKYMCGALSGGCVSAVRGAAARATRAAVRGAADSWPGMLGEPVHNFPTPFCPCSHMDVTVRKLTTNFCHHLPYYSLASTQNA